MKEEKITCDGCGADLTYTANCVGYRVMLATENIPIYPNAGAVTAMGVFMPLERAHHFCGLHCLDMWREKSKQS